MLVRLTRTAGDDQPVYVNPALVTHVIGYAEYTNVYFSAITDQNSFAHVQVKESLDQVVGRLNIAG